jgi:hypothetical protein
VRSVIVQIFIRLATEHLRIAQFIFTKKAGQKSSIYFNCFFDFLNSDVLREICFCFHYEKI